MADAYEYLDLVIQIDRCGVTLPERSADFIADMLEHLDEGGSLSPKQAQWIEDLYDRYVINRGVR